MTDSWRTRLGILLIVLGAAGVIVAFGPLQFGDRIAGRVEAAGTVQWGLHVEATSPDDEVADGEYGAWKVDYEIDGSSHTGVIIGEYFEGQQLVISAPSDGSIYSVLHEGTSTGLKILSWFVIPLALAAAVIGGWWTARGLRAADARNREVARQQLARLYPHLFPLTATGPSSGPAGQGGPFRNLQHHASQQRDAQQHYTQQQSDQQYGAQQQSAQQQSAQQYGAQPYGDQRVAGPDFGNPPFPPRDGEQDRAARNPDFFAPYDI